MTRRIAVAALATGLWFTSVANAGAQLPWKTLDWNVFCGPPLVALGSQDLCDQENAAAIQLARTQLEITSRYLEALGFSGPALSAFRDPGIEDAPERGTEEWKEAPFLNGVRETIYGWSREAGDDPRCLNKYCARLVAESVDGSYIGTHQTLRISPHFWRGLMPGSEVWLFGDDAVMTPSHELFHAIQYGYEPVVDAAWECIDWIIEGSATALEMVMSQGAAAGHIGWRRYYDDALNRPPGPCRPSADPSDPNARHDYSEWAYGTYDFWLYAGAKLRSTARIKYLHEIFQQALEVEDGLRGVHYGFLAAGGASLAQVYTDFVTEELTIDKQCHFRPLGEFEWHDCKKKASDEFRISLEVTEAKPRAEDGRAVDTKKFATSAFVVRTEVPTEAVGGLVIEIPEPAEDQWRLVVDERRYDEVDPLTRTRNRAMVVVPGGTDSVFVRVVHAPDDPAYSPGRPTELLELELTLLEGCSPSDMLSAVDPELAFGEGSGDASSYGAPQYMPGQTMLRGAVEGRSSETRGLAGWVASKIPGVDARLREQDPEAMAEARAGMETRRLLPPDEYQSQFQPYPEMHPAPGFLRITGLVQDTGVGCTSPIGTNPLFEAGTPAESMAGMAERMSSMSPEEMRALFARQSPDSSFFAVGQVMPQFDNPGMRQAQAGMMAAMGSDGDALIQIFSPNLATWQLDQIGAGFLTRHGGLGGWDANASAAFTIQVPGRTPQDLMEDSIYDARLFLLAGAPAWSYSRWNGVQAGPERIFTGEIELVEVSGMEGQVWITGLTGAAVEGNFWMEGPAKRNWRVLRNGEVVSENETSGDVRINGSFVAPAAIEVQRPGRVIAFTHKVQKKRPDVEGCQPNCTPPPPPDEDCEGDCPPPPPPPPPEDCAKLGDCPPGGPPPLPPDPRLGPPDGADEADPGSQADPGAADGGGRKAYSLPESLVVTALQLTPIDPTGRGFLDAPRQLAEGFDVPTGVGGSAADFQATVTLPDLTACSVPPGLAEALAPLSSYSLLGPVTFGIGRQGRLFLDIASSHEGAAHYVRLTEAGGGTLTVSDEGDTTAAALRGGRMEIWVSGTDTYVPAVCDGVVDLDLVVWKGAARE